MSDTENKNALIYVRVSSKEQEKEGFSIPAQKKFLKEYAIKKGLRIIDIYEEAETAKKAGRTQFRKMIERIKNDKSIKNILVEKTDRLYRNFHDYVGLDYKELDIRVHLVKENEILSSSSNSNTLLHHGIKVVLAKHYVDNLSEEVIKGQKQKIEEGGWPGKAPIGYMNKFEGHSVVINHLTAPIVKKAFELSASGNYSLNKLRKTLYELGLRSTRKGKVLSKEQMRRTLKNPFYYGNFEWKGILYKGRHEPLISKVVFDKVQEVMGFIQKPRVSKLQFNYSGVLTCGHCKCSITAEKKKGKYIYYHCTNGKGTCDKVVYLQEQKLDESFVYALSRISIPEETVKWTKESLVESYKEEKEFREAQINALNTRYSKLDQYIAKSYMDKLEGRYRDWETDRKSTRLNSSHLKLSRMPSSA